MPSADGVYTGGKVIYIDTEVRNPLILSTFMMAQECTSYLRLSPSLQGAFQPERLEGICTRFNVDYRAALDNIFFCRVYNSDQLVSLWESRTALC